MAAHFRMLSVTASASTTESANPSWLIKAFESWAIAVVEFTLYILSNFKSIPHAVTTNLVGVGRRSPMAEARRLGRRQ